jgi:hypothetical protein
MHFSMVSFMNLGGMYHFSRKPIIDGKLSTQKEYEYVRVQGRMEINFGDW